MGLLLPNKEFKESDYAELKELCLELGIPYSEMFIDIEYGYPDEEPKKLWEFPQRCHSWVRNGYNQIMACLGSLNLSDASPNWGTGYMNVKDTAGVIKSAATPGFNTATSESVANWIRAAVNVDDYGILVGSGASVESDAVKFERYSLETQLTEASYTHAAMDAPTFAQDGLTSKVSYVRRITNVSGGDSTFREVALVAIIDLGGDNWVMIARDVITPLTLHNNGYIQPTYTFALTYPS